MILISSKVGAALEARLNRLLKRLNEMKRVNGSQGICV